MKKLENATAMGAELPAEADSLVSSLENLRRQLAETVEEIRARYAGVEPVDQQGQRLIEAALEDLEDVESRLRRIRSNF